MSIRVKYFTQISNSGHSINGNFVHAPVVRADRSERPLPALSTQTGISP